MVMATLSVMLSVGSMAISALRPPMWSVAIHSEQASRASIAGTEIRERMSRPL